METTISDFCQSTRRGGCIDLTELVLYSLFFVRFYLDLSVKADSTNEIMRVLTIFASIFIPLTFIAGLYGMNFEYIPELRWRPAYFILLGLMVLMGLSMVRFFRKRGWM